LQNEFGSHIGTETGHVRTNILGRSGLPVSVLGFGCGFVGGLMVQGSTSDQDAAVGMCADLGITYFDTAPHYGSGRSEEHLGRALAGSRIDAVIGTKVMVPTAPGAHIPEAIRTSVEDSLRRLRIDRIDLLQVHNGVSSAPTGNGLTPEKVLEEIVPELKSLQAAGKIISIGMSGLGQSPAISRLIDSGEFDTAQLVVNLLNPSAAAPVPAASGAQNYNQVLASAEKNNMGTIGIRVLAGGALTGSADRHPVALAKVDPIGSGASYAADVQHSQVFRTLVAEDRAEDLTDLAVRYSMSFPFSTVVLGFSSLEQVKNAARSAERGPLDADTLARIAAIQSELFRAEPRTVSET
jgi:aryl-alcohol dehydrogenase-like predicted oxidoreductase